MMKRYLEAGRLNSPRGIKGEIRFACYCDSPEFLSGIKFLYLDSEGKKPLEVVCYRPSIPSLIFRGYEDRSLVSALNGRTVWFDREDFPLPEGSFYYSDLIGTPAFDAKTGEKFGIIEDVEEGIGSNYYIVGGEKRYRIPAVKEYAEKAVPDEGVWFNLTEGLEAENEF